jgi:hypothetical protein
VDNVIAIGLGDGLLRAIKIRSTPSFGEEVNPEDPCRKVSRHVKNPFEGSDQRYFVRPNSSFTSPNSSCFATR